MKIGDAIPSVLAAFGAAGLTAWFTGRRFYREQWWQKKYEAYISIMDALHEMQVGYSQELRALLKHSDVSNEVKAQFVERYRLGRDTVLRSISLAEFIISKEAIVELKRMEIILQTRYEYYNDQLLESDVAINDCLASIRRIARSDLERRPFVDWWHRIIGRRQRSPDGT